MTRIPLRRAGVAAAVAFGLGFGLAAMAASPVQNAPFTTPTYTPTTSAAKLLYTAPGTYVFNTLGNGALSFQFSGGASFAAQLQATVDGTNWTTLPAWPAGGGAPVQTVSANGLYSVPVAGYTEVRVNATAVSGGTLGIQAAGTGHAVAPLPGGAGSQHYLSAATTNATLVKPAPGTVYEIAGLSTNATAAYLKLYNTATTPVCGTGTPVATYPIVQNVPFRYGPAQGIAFSAGIGFCITGAQADGDTTAATTGITLDIDAL